MNALKISAAVLILAISPAIGGEGDANHERAVASCKSKMRSGVFKKRVAFAYCINLANARWWRDNEPDKFDLFEYAAARDTVLAEKFDAGRMTEAEYAAGRAQIRSELFSSAQSRNSMRSVQSPAPRGPITCFTSGHLTQCF